MTLGEIELISPATAGGVADMPNTSLLKKLGVKNELAVTGRCSIDPSDPRVITSEKLNRRPPGVVTVPPGVNPKPGVAGETKMGSRSLEGIGMDMLAIDCALVGLKEEGPA